MKNALAAKAGLLAALLMASAALAGCTPQEELNEDEATIDSVEGTENAY